MQLLSSARSICMKGHLNPAFAWISRLPTAASSLAPWDEPHSELASWASDWALWPNHACHLPKPVKYSLTGTVDHILKQPQICPWWSFSPQKDLFRSILTQFSPMINENLRIVSLPGPQQLLLAHWEHSYWSLLTTILSYSKVRCIPWGLTADLG